MGLRVRKADSAVISSTIATASAQGDSSEALLSGSKLVDEMVLEVDDPCRQAFDVGARRHVEPGEDAADPIA